jgi:hypothetical protein
VANPCSPTNANRGGGSTGGGGRAGGGIGGRGGIGVSGVRTSTILTGPLLSDTTMTDEAREFQKRITQWLLEARLASVVHRRSSDRDTEAPRYDAIDVTPKPIRPALPQPLDVFED